ncbi:MAG: hypothetical protein ABUS57_06660 [Pseudomonadota bacterium]
MKPFNFATELFPVQTQPAQKAPKTLQRVWVKVNGKLECRWMDPADRA